MVDIEGEKQPGASRRASSTSVPLASAPQWKKYKRYDVDTDPNQNDMAKEIKLCGAGRPHMRAFHLAWYSFFVAFFVWFAIVPLIPDIKHDLGLTNDDIWLSTIAGFAGTVIVRLVLGPLCDVYGPRVLTAAILCISAIPAGCVGLVNTSTGLILVRLFIGIAGGVFVMCQYWTSVMFTKEIVGTANGIVGGWGNLGAGVTNLFMGMILYPLFQVFFDDDKEMAWRTVPVVPAVIAFVTGVIMYYSGDDCPKGNYSELKQRGVFSEVSVLGSFKSASLNSNSWLLFVQYGCCFGVELTMTVAASNYFKEQFDLTTESAAAISTLFGWMNIFARGLGGFFSDISFNKWGMTGRLAIQSLLLAVEGIFVMVFSQTATLAGSIVAMVFFSFFVQASEGATFGIVPHIDERHTGSVSGIVSAGGNAGAICFSLAFKYMDSDKNAFMIMGGSALVASFLTIFIKMDGQKGLVFSPFNVPETTSLDKV